MSEVDLGGGMWLIETPIADLREADVNAHMMPKEKFERLVENIRKRGRLESLPYVAQPNGEGPLLIVSGHHRTRAAAAAGLKAIHVLCDRSEQTRSTIIAKQLAHNALVGFDDGDLLRQLAGMLESVDDMLSSGLPSEFLPTAQGEAITLFSPHADFAFKFVTLSFLDHQVKNFDELCKALAKQPQEIVGVVAADLWKPFIDATAKYARLKDIRSVGTAVALLIEIALREAQALEDEQAKREAAEADAPTKAKRKKSDAA